ncbi:MAG: SDR family NAD(P)-dependent oxidoreductase [Thermonemataceae bacterium]
MQKNILVVGGTSGIGLALTEQLAKENTLWVASRKPTEALKELGVTHIDVDVTQDVEGKFDALPDELHGLVYSVGTINLKPFHRLNLDDFQQDFSVNVLGAIRVLQENYKKLKKAKGASVVLFSTVASTLGMNFHASVATAKSAVEGLGRSLAAEWASQKIRVNIVAPSLTQTPLAARLLSTEEKIESADKRHPIGRVGQPEDLANIASFLLSEEATWITGQTIGVDGGLGTLKP